MHKYTCAAHPERSRAAQHVTPQHRTQQNRTAQNVIKARHLQLARAARVSKPPPTWAPPYRRRCRSSTYSGARVLITDHSSLVRSYKQVDERQGKANQTLSPFFSSLKSHMISHDTTSRRTATTAPTPMPKPAIPPSQARPKQNRNRIALQWKNADADTVRTSYS